METLTSFLFSSYRRYRSLSVSSILKIESIIRIRFQTFSYNYCKTLFIYAICGFSSESLGIKRFASSLIIHKVEKIHALIRCFVRFSFASRSLILHYTHCNFIFLTLYYKYRIQKCNHLFIL